NDGNPNTRTVPSVLQGDVGVHRGFSEFESPSDLPVRGNVNDVRIRGQGAQGGCGKRGEYAIYIWEGFVHSTAQPVQFQKLYSGGRARVLHNDAHSRRCRRRREVRGQFFGRDQPLG